MSNQFFNYISEMLYEHLKNYISPGDRFYLQLDEKEDIKGFIDALGELTNAETFEYQLDSGAVYRTFAININGVRLVVASTIEGVTPDFLVTLRNQVGEQAKGWESTALLSVVSEQLDSIQGGSSDLQKEGMPFHPQTLHDHLYHEISNSVLEKVDQNILLENLDRLKEDQYIQQVTLLDFQDILAVLNKGAVDDGDYKRFGLFKDYDLNDKTNKQIRERLRKNAELFEYVKNAHDFGSEVNEVLSDKFSDKGVKSLKEDNWEETPFSTVHNSMEEKNRDQKNAKVQLEDLKMSGNDFWDRPQKETAAGKRKRQIIIFNPEQLEELSLQAKFDLSGNTVQSLKDDFVSIQKQFRPFVEAKTGSKNLSVTLYPEKQKPTFTKVSYKHDGKAALGCEFHIVILPFSSNYLEDIKTRYKVNVKDGFLELNSDVEELVIGSGFNNQEIELTSQNQTVTLKALESAIIKPTAVGFDEDDQLAFNLGIEGYSPLQVMFNNELPETMPINAKTLWNMKREMQQNFVYQNGRLLIGNREFYSHSEYSKFLEWELEFLKNNALTATISSDEIYVYNLDVSSDLVDAATEFQNYFITVNSTPTLAFAGSDYQYYATQFIKAYLEEIERVSHNGSAEDRLNLMKLGTVKAPEGVYLTPFHPLMVAYQIEVNNRLKDKEIEKSILKRLHVNGLLPFMQVDDELYKPDTDHDFKEWLLYKPLNEVSVSDAENYLQKVVFDKVKQFKEHFSYLFINNSQAALKVNVINISNDHEVLKGLLEWFVNQIKRSGPNAIHPIEVSLYRGDYSDSSFDLFSSLGDASEIAEAFDIKLEYNDIPYDGNDLVRFIRESLFYYKYDIDDELSYAHLTFYKMLSDENHVIQPMSDMITGVSLDGMLSSVPSMKGEDDYKGGFGTHPYNMDVNDLLKVAYFTNELTANVSNEGKNTYIHNNAIMSSTSTDDEKTLEKIFNSSYWVTFVDPSMDLEYFQNYSRNLVIIHYSDQYSSSSRYDAITVTDKSNQYNKVIKEFLVNKGVNVDDDEIDQVIKTFNAFNGEWLLRIIGSKGHYDREKLSIISAIKYSLAYYNHDDILWVPISLEEVLRVAGAVGLDQKGGVFTAKNLGVEGSHSDDLLLVGVERRGEEVDLHFYPIEVKIGHNNSHVIDKAHEQLRKTKHLFEEYLTQKNDQNEVDFTKQFYRQFFVQLLISNLNKLRQSNVWPDKFQTLTDQTLYQLLSDQFNVSERLVPLMGKGGIISFETDRAVGKLEYDNQITTFYLTESDGLNGVVKSINKLTESLSKDVMDLPSTSMLQKLYVKEEIEETTQHDVRDNSSDHSGDTQDQGFEPDVIETKEPKEDDHKSLNDQRILIGDAEGSNQQIYWEFGNKDLANRHLLISGKSGQGKTYFMQCLLYEMSQKGIPSIVIDYTEGFLPNQLEEEFISGLGGKLNQTIVYNEQFPINPFKKSKRNIGGIEIEENETDVAERIKSVFSAVYPSLGVQQLNAIYEATQNGVKKYEEHMSLVQLKDELESLGSNYAQKTLSQIRNLIDRNPFSVTEKEMDWSSVIKSDGEVHIIQLTGYPRDVQLMITEFILWDLWNYSVRNGDKSIPIPVVMDEAQNLDHREHSPSARILTEGRKFGWSGWYATQFLKSQLDADELARLQNSSQKVYFSPPEQELRTIAESISNDREERAYWEKRLGSLRKGQCVVHGPMLHNRELTKPVAQIVNITPFGER